MMALFTACATNRDKGYVEDTDPEMAAAIAKAQATLPHFWQVFDKRARGESNFVLVVRITDKGRIEHFSTTDFERRDGKTMVSIGNKPKYTLNVTNPADITASVYIPSTNNLAGILESGHAAASSPGVLSYYFTNWPNWTNGATVFQVGSGGYSFSVTNVSF